MQRRIYSQAARTARYVMDMVPTLNRDALFADESMQYVRPMEPKVGDTVTFRFRTARDNAEEVWLISEHLRQKMEFVQTAGVFDYYETSLTVGREPLIYHFVVICGTSRVVYGKNGLSARSGELVPFRLCPGFSTPDWAKGAVIYQIFTDRFCNGDPSNDVLDDEYFYNGTPVRRVADWYRRPEIQDVHNFYGGDLEGVRSKLDYLKDLGIEVIYLNPLFVSPSNHKYDTQDYDHIDPHFGVLRSDGGDVLPRGETDNGRASRYRRRVTDRENLEASGELFCRLVEEAHARGIRVILDGVFNHCGSFHRWMDRERIYEGRPGYAPGAYGSGSSPYRDYFHFRETKETDWPGNDSYEGWWGYRTLPKLYYEGSQQLTSDILAIARKWVSPPYNADGWRLDVAADLGQDEAFNHRFWKAFRHEVKAANPDAVIIAEHYGDASGWLGGDEWDSVMNYDAFMEPVTWFFTGMEKHSDAYCPELEGDADVLRESMRSAMCAFMQPSLLCAMNQLSNHDHSRFLTRTNHRVGRISDFDHDAASEDVNPAVLREAVVFQMTWPGAPALYYGDEAGLTGFTDPDCRRTYPWGREDRGLLEFFRQAIALRREYKVLKTGSVRFLYGARDAAAFARFDEKQQIVSVFNNGEEAKEMRVPVWIGGVPADGALKLIFRSDRGRCAPQEKKIPVVRGEAQITIPARCAGVFLACPAAGSQTKGGLS